MNWRKPFINLAFKFRGQPVFKRLKFLKSVEYNKPQELLKLQQEKLAAVLRHAAANVPFYRHILADTGVVRDNQVDICKFESIPFLTKNIIRQVGDQLYSTDVATRRSFRNSTGGSTGEPMKFLQDKDYEAWSFASRFLFNSWAGKDVGEREILLWGSEKDVLGQAEKISTRLRRWGFNTFILNSFLMTDVRMREYAEKWNAFRPKQVWAYTSSILEFARFIRADNISIFHPSSIICAAETLTQDVRQVVEETFGCPALNQYGCREAGAIACECPKKEGLHVFILDNKIEILNEKHEPCRPGELGRIYVTTLNNYSMPLIRYDIGDMAEAGDGSLCSCGRAWPLIKAVVGRGIEVFRTRDGRTIPGEFFIHFVGVVYNQGFIRKFQVVQKDFDLIKIRTVIADERKFSECKNSIVESICRVMGQQCHIEFENVPDILPAGSGKYLYTICELPGN